MGAAFGTHATRRQPRQHWMLHPTSRVRDQPPTQLCCVPFIAFVRSRMRVATCAASVLAHAPERGTQAGELLLQTRSGPATGTCSEADDGDDASEADDVAARQFAGLTRLQLDEVGRERQVQQQGRQRAEAPAERSVEIAQAMVPLAAALARGGG